jgi:ABC-2 type transport system permease protein
MTMAHRVQRTPGIRLRWAVEDSWTLTARHLKHVLHAPDRILGALLFPVVSILLFGYVFGSAITVPGGGDYREYLMPAIFVQTMMFGIIGQAVAVATDAAKGVTDRFRSIPMSPSAVLLGQTFAEVLNAVLTMTLMFGCGFVVGWRWHGGTGETLAAIGLLLLLRFSITWVGLYIGMLVRSPEAASSFVPLIFPFTMIANTFVPPQAMPGWLGTIAEWNPVSATVAATRQLFGNPGAFSPDQSWPMHHPVLMAVIWPLVIMAIFVPLALSRYRRKYR